MDYREAHCVYIRLPRQPDHRLTWVQPLLLNVCRPLVSQKGGSRMFSCRLATNTRTFTTTRLNVAKMETKVERCLMGWSKPMLTVMY